MRNSWIIRIVFLGVLACLFFFLGFDKIFFLDPQGIHFMRQTDSLSFASQYYNNGYNFFKPQLYNLMNIEGRAACEFPITYYLTALLYFILGKKLFLLKLLHIVIVYVGVFYTYKLTYLILRDYFYAALICLFLFSSTVFNYYSFNYLPDAPALGFTLIGWFFFFSYQINDQKKTIFLSFLFFTLGSLIKVTYLVNPLSILLLSIYFILFKKKETIDNVKAKTTLFYGIIGLMVVIFWNVYMLYYNALYDSKSFNTQAHPIWNLSKEGISEVWDYIINYWYTSYFGHSSFHFLLVALLFQIVFLKKSDNKLTLVILILFFGNLAYFILFYSQFRDHDYYFMTFLPFVILFMTNGIKSLQNVTKKIVHHVAIKLILLIVVIVGINYSRLKLTDRYDNAYDDFSRIGFLIKNNLKEIEKLEISNDSKFIVAPDLCQNGGLLFLDKMGWNIQNPEDISISKINLYNNLGAEYLLLATDENTILNIGDSTGNLFFEGKGISIYKLNNTKDNKK